MGSPYAERGAITDEAIAVMKALWTQEDPSFAGKYSRFSRMPCSPHDEAPPTQQALAPLRLTLPDGRALHAHDPNVSALLSTVLGCPVMLERAQADQHHRAAIDPATVFGDVPVETLKPGFTAATLPDSFALPPGTFFDAASLHSLASGTLTHLRTLTGEDAQLDVRRFRPNMVIDTEVGLEGFVEDD